MIKIKLIILSIIGYSAVIHGQVFLNAGLGTIQNYSEWDEPTIFEKEFLWQYKVELGYFSISKDRKAKYISLGYERREAESKSNTGPNTFSPTSRLVEESFPLTYGHFWVRNYLHFGVGPVLMLTRQSLYHPIWDGDDFEESIMILSPGCSVLVRSVGKPLGELGLYAQFEGRVTHSVASFGNGVDLNEYSHYFSMVGVTLGVQF